MRNVTQTITIMSMAFLSLTVMSCDSKKEDTTNPMNSEMNHEGMNQDGMNTSNNMMDSDAENSNTKQLFSDYMELKDALVATNKDEAAKAGKKLESSLEGFNPSSYSSEEQKELIDIIEDAKEHAEHIAESDIKHQREHFKTLSQDMIDLVAITGTEKTMYQQFCPMFDGGSAWLSMEKEIKNPYYGNKMLDCGEVQKEIN